MWSTLGKKLKNELLGGAVWLHVMGWGAIGSPPPPPKQCEFGNLRCNGFKDSGMPFHKGIRCKFLCKVMKPIQFEQRKLLPIGCVHNLKRTEFGNSGLIFYKENRGMFLCKVIEPTQFG